MLIVTDSRVWSPGSGRNFRFTRLVSSLCRFGIQIDLVTSRNDLAPEEMGCLSEAGITRVIAGAGPESGRKKRGFRSSVKRWIPDPILSACRYVKKASQKVTSSFKTGKNEPRRLVELRSSMLSNLVMEYAEKYCPDFVMVEYLMHGYVLEVLKRIPARARPVTLIDTHDVAYQRCEAMAGHDDSEPIMISREEEQEVLERFDIVIAIQDEDRATFEEMLPGSCVVTCLPSCGSNPVEMSPDYDPKSVLFVGGKSSHNAEGLKQFLEHSWPGIIDEHPEATLTVVGNVDRCFEDQSYPGVHFAGYVTDQRESYASAAAVISPIVFGSGLKIKVLEGMASGRPVVATRHSSIGFNGAEGHGLLVADDWSEFTALLNDLFEEPERVRSLGASAAAYVDHQFDGSRVMQELITVMGDHLSPGNESLCDDAIIVRRPNYHLKNEFLHFLISRRPYARLNDDEQTFWNAIDGETRLEDLRSRTAVPVEKILMRFIEMEVCEQLPTRFPGNRKRVVVIEPHMDDAALSVGGTLWQQRHECEPIIVTVAGISNFTSYFQLDREYFDIEEITGVRKAESDLFARLIGGRHIALDRMEAPLRYDNGGWTLDWFRTHYPFVFASMFHCSGSSEHFEWSTVIEKTIEELRPEEIWMPLGIGKHVDHELVRNACLNLLTSNTALFKETIVKFYEDVPYAESFPEHAAAIIEAMREKGLLLEEENYDISADMGRKMRLLSLFNSQFKIDHIRARVEQCATLAGSPAIEHAERMYRVTAHPSDEINPISCRIDGDAVYELARRMEPWLKKNLSASRIRLFLLGPVGRWNEDIMILLNVFTRARFEIYIEKANLVETETFTSKRIIVRSVRKRWRYWLAALARTIVTRRYPLVIISAPGREGAAEMLRSWSIGSDTVVANSMSQFLSVLHLSGQGAS